MSHALIEFLEGCRLLSIVWVNRARPKKKPRMQNLRGFSYPER